MAISLSRWPWFRRWFGTRSERAAARFLKRLGYRILTHNYACPGGELDLVALDGLEVVFVEVRSTSNRDIERTVASVNREKQRRISLAARHYLAAHRLEDRIGRFDVLIVCWPKEVQSPRIEHFPNAFSVIG